MSNTPSGPLTEEEIASALKRNGYPLEIRVLQTFHQAGFDPVIGHRFLSGEGEKSTSVEVDIMAQCAAELANSRGMVILKALVEAKQLNEPMVFVGLKWRQPELYEKRKMRSRASARPTCMVLSRGASGQDLNGQRLVQLLLDGPEPIAAALDSLNEPLVCAHWANVNRHKEHKVLAEQTPTHKDSFAKLLRVLTRLEEETARHFSQTADTQLRIQILTPTIVLGTPDLYVYDALNDSLEKTSSVILKQTYESDGQIHSRYVDIVTENRGVAELIDRYQRATHALRIACDNNVDELARLAHAQSQRAQSEGLSEINRKLRDHTSRGSRL